VTVPVTVPFGFGVFVACGVLVTDGVFVGFVGFVGVAVGDWVETLVDVDVGAAGFVGVLVWTGAIVGGAVGTGVFVEVGGCVARGG
jgi:hypothetical protein